MKEGEELDFPLHSQEVELRQTTAEEPVHQIAKEAGEAHSLFRKQVQQSHKVDRVEQIEADQSCREDSQDRQQVDREPQI